MLFNRLSRLSVFVGSACLLSCQSVQHSENVESPIDFYGTQHPFAAEAIYFVMTDRFVDGDPSNNFPEQGGDYPTFDIPLVFEDGREANVGYLGGDLKGVINNGQYIADMGFTAVWLTPIVDNPDQAFAGGEPITFGGKFKDGGKTGYHGYWANNFYQIDEHYPSPGLDYKTYTKQMRNEFGLKSVFDIVGNHGSPSFSMPEDQPKFGELYDLQGKLVADHQNLPPEQLDKDNPLHDFYHQQPDIMQLSNLNDENPALQDYLINSYLYWIEQGADAFRIDTIKHVPHHFWKKVADRVRAKYPDFFMFAESFNHDANFIAQHTLPKNGAISVLDFPGQSAMVSVFENADSDFASLTNYLHLTHGPYSNPYDLTTFYDNHDMARMNTTDQGFINAHNWLFTSRGIPVVYQGSEIGFMRGAVEHEGNRNYFGQARIEEAKQHDIHRHLTRIANVRKQTPALQRGLQVNVRFEGDIAVFYRVLQLDDIAQTALVILNKGQEPKQVTVSEYLQTGEWRSRVSDAFFSISARDQRFDIDIPANGVEVLVREGEITGTELQRQLSILMENK